MKRILVTGHNGLLGSACVRHFSEKNHVLTIDGVDLREPVRTRAAIAALKPDYIVHCAAKVGGVKANRDFPVEFITDNLLIQTNVINSAAEFNVEKLVFIGTSCMFPRDAALPVVEESLLTGKLDDSVEAYAIAKIAGWRLCKAHFEQYGRKFITVNPCNIYGLNDNYSSTAHVIPALIRRMWEAKEKGESLKVWGDGSAVREFIYADDVAAAIEFAMDHWDSPEVLNIGTGESTEISYLVEIVSAAMLFSGNVEYDDSFPTGIPRKTFDVGKLKSMGWQPNLHLIDGIVRTCRDFIANLDKNLVDVRPSTR